MQNADARSMLGLHVKVKGVNGKIRYIGKTHFAEGEWIGVELNKPSTRSAGGAH